MRRSTPTKRISLDGTWRIKPYLGEEWRFRRPFAPDSTDVHGWVPATVPGSVVADLVAAGEVPDVLVDRASRTAEWVATRAWAYRREVTLPPETGERRVLACFDGIDPAAEVYVNGAHVGSHEGMFVPAVFDVTDVVRPGVNLVTLVLAPAPDSQPQVGRTELVRHAKSRMTYGWDFCPRLVHVGVWDRCWIELGAGLRLTDVAVRPRLDESLGRAEIAWTATAEIGGTPPLRMADEKGHRALTAEVTIRRADDRGGDVLSRDRITRELAEEDHRRAGTVRGGTSGVGRAPLRGTLALDAPALWWPHTHGGQARYTLAVRVTTDGGGSDVRELDFGIRSVTLAANDGAPPDARGYTVVVNGRRIYAHGWNWVPLDVHHGVEDPDRLEHLLDLAMAAGVNLLRVWGGGLIEKEAFYDACDRRGILVWQEFPQSSSGISSVPPDDPDFIPRLTAAAEAAVRRRHHHPSLALWCGGNELTAAGGAPARGDEPALAALAAVVDRLDPDRPFLPTSPTGPVASCTLENIERDPDGQHDVHGPWEHQGIIGQRTLFDRATSLLHSEFGVEGMANLATLDAYLSPEHRWPADRSNPRWVHRGDWWINTPLMRSCFPGAVDDLVSLQRASQFLQAEGLRYAVEANRRRQWRNSGSLPWQFNESFPNGFCTSAVDYRGRPKAAYHDTARAHRAVLANAAFPTIAWGGRPAFTAAAWLCTGREPVRGRMVARLVGADGGERERASWPVDVPAEAAREIGSVTWPFGERAGAADETGVFWLDLAVTDASGAPEASARYVFSRTDDLAPLLRLPPTAIEVEDADGGLVVRNTGEIAAMFVTAHDARPARSPGYAAIDGGHACLLPGEEQRIGVRWRGVPRQDRRMTVTGWNTTTGRNSSSSETPPGAAHA